MDGRGGVRGEKGVSFSICAILPSATFLWSTTVALIGEYLFIHNQCEPRPKFWILRCWLSEVKAVGSVVAIMASAGAWWNLEEFCRASYGHHFGGGGGWPATRSQATCPRQVLLQS
jgi:hypothetical protein